MWISFRYLGIKVPLSFISQIPVAILKLEIFREIKNFFDIANRRMLSLQNERFVGESW